VPGQLTQLNDRLQVGRPGFNFRQGLGIFLFDTASRPGLGPIQPLSQWVLSPEIKWPGREADYSAPSSAEFKNA